MGVKLITFEQSGSFKHMESFLQKMSSGDLFRMLDRFAQQGVTALASATPYESGLTASSWSYEIKHSSSSYSITWTNSHIVDGVPIAIILQYGHGTGTGGYVSGRDYINPTLKPIFDKIADEVWKVVTSA
jgi:hypothetical protein